LIAGADVVMENFRPDVFARLGFDEKTLAEINPNLIFASATGFGSTGPLAQNPGQDLLAQARSGMIAATGTPDHAPTPVGAAIVDQHGGALLAMGILGALVRRLREGRGTRVEASLINSAIDLQNEPLVNYFAGGKNRDVLNRDMHLATWYHGAPYGVYPARDGHVVISLCDATALADALESGALRDLISVDRYLERDEYARRLAAATISYTADELAERFDRKGIWWAPINYYDALLSDPQLIHSGVFRQIKLRGRTIHLVNHPNRYDGEVPELRVLALEIGAHTREILSELGYEEGEVQRLLDTKAVAASRDEEAIATEAASRKVS
jgi:crotonobetainyl-CoA:carnitine CoA-transferase CaiB-like acyl-CoA transferase